VPKRDVIGIPTPTDLPSAIAAIKLLTEAVRQLQLTLTSVSGRLDKLT
jgi:hypothetical protein